MENPILKRELKIRLRVKKIIPAIVLRYVFLGFIFLLVLLAHLGKGLLAFILAETVLLMLFIPGNVCMAFTSSTARGDFLELTMTRMGSIKILLGKFAGATFYNCIIILLSALIMFAIHFLRGNFNVWHLVFANISLLVVAFVSGVISLLFSVLFRQNTFAAALTSYILIFLLLGSIIIPGPLIGRMQNQRAKAIISKISLHINPLIMVSRTLGNIDIMRTRYMYILADPIVAPGFKYPDWRYTGILYLSVSFILLIPVYLRLKFTYTGIQNN